MNKFKPGDPVWVLTSRYDLNMVGEKAGIVEGQIGSTFYRVTIEGYPSPDIDGLWVGPEDTLRPRRDDSDASKWIRQETTDWSKCAWRPAKVAA